MSDDDTNQVSWRPIIASLFVLVLLWLASPGILWLIRSFWIWVGFEASSHGTFLHDSFDVTASLFGAAALIGAVVSILIQRVELRSQREELRLQREEMARQSQAMEQSSAAQAASSHALLKQSKISAYHFLADGAGTLADTLDGTERAAAIGKLRAYSRLLEAEMTDSPHEPQDIFAEWRAKLDELVSQYTISDANFDKELLQLFATKAIALNVEMRLLTEPASHRCHSVDRLIEAIRHDWDNKNLRPATFETIVVCFRSIQSEISQAFPKSKVE